MEGEAERKQIVEVVEEQADGALRLEGVDITQPWLAAQSLAMAAATQIGIGVWARTFTKSGIESTSRHRIIVQTTHKANLSYA